MATRLRAETLWAISAAKTRSEGKSQIGLDTDKFSLKPTVHEKNVEFLGRADHELLETVGEEVAGLGVGAVTRLKEGLVVSLDVFSRFHGPAGRESEGQSSLESRHDGQSSDNKYPWQVQKLQVFPAYVSPILGNPSIVPTALSPPPKLSPRLSLVAKIYQPNFRHRNVALEPTANPVVNTLRLPPALADTHEALRVETREALRALLDDGDSVDRGRHFD